MYCSEACQDEAERTFHNFECSLIEVLLKTGIMQMAMRFFFQSLNVFDGNILKMKNFLENCENSSTSVYDFDFSKVPQNPKNFLQTAYCLARSDNIPTDSPEMLFMLHPVLEQMWKFHSKFIKQFIRRIIRIYDSNFHGICGWSLQQYDNHEAKMIGVGCYIFASMLNHSCAPNVNRMYVNDKMIIVVDRPIKKGQQIFDCYK
jgi:hypothetical protein